MRVLSWACGLAAAVAAGCRAAPGPTSPTVANAAAPAAAPTAAAVEQACVTAVLADAGDDAPPETPIAHAAAVARGRIVCAVEVRGADATETMSGLPVRAVEVTVAVLAPAGAGWRVTDRVEASFDEGRDEQSGRDVEIKIEPLAIRDDETGVLVTMIQREDGPEYGRDDTRAVLYRVVDDALATTWEASWTATTGEADSVEQRTVTLADTATGGFRDLAVAVYRREVEWATGGHCPIEYEIAERWAWDDGAYALAEAEEPPADPVCDDGGDDGDGDDGDDGDD